MLFTPKRFSWVQDVVLIYGKRVMEVSETKFLGFIIDNRLNWKSYIRYVCTGVAKGIGIILKSRKVFIQETLSTLYYTFVYPYLNYCIHVRVKAYNTHLKDLCVLQNNIICIINGIPPRTNVDHLYVQQNILSVNRLYYYNIGIFMYKSSNGMLPEMFDSFFSRIEDTHSYHTHRSSAKHLHVNFRNTLRGQRSSVYSSAITWNCVLNNFNPECDIGLIKKNNPQHYSWTQKVTFYMKLVQQWFKTMCYIWSLFLIMIFN